MNRTFFRFCTSGVFATAMLLNPANPQAAQKPNVLFIAIDDLRPELGCYGSPLAKSPNIDKLASEGLLFNKAYCQLALCNPSRASLLSGMRPETIGVFDLKTFVRDNRKDVVTLPELLKTHGYRTLRFGKIFHTTNGNHDDPISWSEKPYRRSPLTTAAKSHVVDPKAKDHAGEHPYGNPDCVDEDLPDGQLVRAAIIELRNHNSTSPLFLAVGFHKPHLPFVAPKKYWDMYTSDSIKLPTNDTLPAGAPAFATNDSSELRRYYGVPKTGPIDDDMAHKLIHGYLACVSYIDAQVGLLMDELDRSDLRENTVVILWGDHGYHLGEHGTWNKRTNWEIATRVPMVISAPGQKARGAKTDALVEFVDIYPTLAELCGLPPPGNLEGKSFVQLMQDPAKPWKNAAFSIYQKDLPGAATGYGRAMRTQRYRFIEWAADDGSNAVYELYDHETDPQETSNLANDPERATLVAELKKQLHAGWKAALP